MASETAKRRKLKAGRNTALILARINAGLSPNQLGLNAQVSGATVRNAEDGYFIEPAKQRAICDALEIEDVLTIFPPHRQRDAPRKADRQEQA